jgi:hypothetical protein
MTDCRNCKTEIKKTMMGWVHVVSGLFRCHKVPTPDPKALDTGAAAMGAQDAQEEMMSDTKLKPCPFCGDLPRTQRNREGGLFIFSGGGNCEVTAEIEAETEMEDQEAIRLWNTRPVEDALVEALKAALPHMRNLHTEDAYGECGNGPLAECRCGLSDDYDLAIKALAKAEGRQ